MQTSLVVEIVNAVADANEIEPAEIEYALEEYVPTIALDALANHDSDSWTLSFELPDNSVTIVGHGVILVDGTPIREWK